MKKVTMVGNSHIDPVWLWREREGLQAARSTFASALQRMEEFPEFEYTASSAALYAWMEENCPEVFEQIRRRVAEGRWHLAGGWWVEPDCNVPGGESLIRQGLYGQRYFERAFGKMADCGYNVDSFGHQAGIPAILKGQGLRGYMFMRPQPDQLDLPAPAFRWTAEDGTSVVGERCEGEYCAWTRTAIVENLDKTLAAMDQTGLEHLCVFYGVGNHGGGPTIENIKAIRELKLERPELDMENGGPADFLDKVDAQSLPEFTGEMEGCFPGCFTVEAELKRLVRLAEEALCKAEILCVMSGADKRAALTEAWKLLLFNEFHDTLAGTARKESRDDAADDLKRCLSVAREIIGGCIQHLSSRFDTRGDGFPLLLLNPTDAPFDGVVDVDTEWRSKYPMRLKDAQGVEIDYDESPLHLVAPGARKHFVFRAQIPPFGAAVYRMMPEAMTIPHAPMAMEAGTLENEHLLARFDGGVLVSLTDKATGREMLTGPVELRVYEDKRDTWGAQGEIGKHLGTYKAVDWFAPETGAARASIICLLERGKSEAQVRYSLGRGERFLRAAVELNNRERFAMTALHFPLAEAYETVLAEAAYAEQERPYQASGEKNCLRYVDLLGENGGLLLCQRAKCGYRVAEGGFELLLSRTSIHAFGSGEDPKDLRLKDFADLGEDRVELTLTPHGAELTRAGRMRAAIALHREPEILAVEQHLGAEPRRTLSAASLTGCEECVLTQLKHGEDGGVILRVKNCGEQDASGLIHYEGGAWPVTIPARALRSFHLLGDELTECNLLEKTE